MYSLMCPVSLPEAIKKRQSTLHQPIEDYIQIYNTRLLSACFFFTAVQDVAVDSLHIDMGPVQELLLL